ncbi:hypothetical protein FDF58_15745 [Clostridium argentinense]|nr:hypothetical protein [Clostridium argentinense]NFP50605.1 hypothetical protein [Clostridium argentinense]NFP72447.1 hypothetical protein [Clostridium argentinense]NFP77935.1 hypothetical protein [Clostridium argentinense]
MTFDKAWNKIIERHKMFRTLFRWEGLNNPIQINLKKHLLSIGFLTFPRYLLPIVSKNILKYCLKTESCFPNISC